MSNHLLNLSLSLAKAEFKLRNEGSYLGLLWYLLNPILLFLLLFLVFFDRLGSSIASYPAYLLLGIFMLNLFSRVTIESTLVILKNDGFIKSIKFPREALVISIFLKYFFSHIFELLIFLFVLIILNIPLYGMIFYPIILILMGIFTYGVSLFLAAITVFFVDLNNIWDFFTKLLLFATPIFYDIGGQTKLFIFNLFNPLYYFITIARDVVIYSKIPELWVILGAFVYAFLSLAVGTFIFGKLKKKFAELL